MLDVLKREGYIRGYSTTDYGNGRTEFEIELKYYDGEPVISEIERVSKPGRRVYEGQGLPRVANGLGMSILSTPGVMAMPRPAQPMLAARSSAGVLRTGRRRVWNNPVSRRQKPASPAASPQLRAEPSPSRARTSN